jgi:hypothetical protein
VRTYFSIYLLSESYLWVLLCEECVSFRNEQQSSSLRGELKFPGKQGELAGWLYGVAEAGAL